MRKFFTSCFGLGFLPVAPGTWGSMPVAVIFMVMNYFGCGNGIILTVLALLVLSASVVCVVFAPTVIKRTGKDDPGEVVADEFAGQAVTFMLIGSVPLSVVWVVPGLGFLLFRFFDIVKPWPIHKLEKLPGGWGILADDLMAGVYAGASLVICYHTGIVEYFSGILSFSS